MKNVDRKIEGWIGINYFQPINYILHLFITPKCAF